VFVDSHCHLDFPELRDELPRVLDAMRDNQVTHALCIAVEMEAWPAVHALARAHANLYATVGVHPDYADTAEPTEGLLVERAAQDKVVAIGETGLDYYRETGDLGWQRARFRKHIRAARTAGRPLVIHTRAAAEDTLAIMRDERASEAGGVMHCFTESWAFAEQALALGFHISFSGIVTFKNAARPDADRDRQSLPGAGAASRQAQPAGVCPPRRRGDSQASRRSRRHHRRGDIGQFLPAVRNSSACSLTDWRARRWPA
jgi:TatD DNase family protein